MKTICTETLGKIALRLVYANKGYEGLIFQDGKERVI